MKFRGKWLAPFSQYLNHQSLQRAHHTLVSHILPSHCQPSSYRGTLYPCTNCASHPRTLVPLYCASYPCTVHPVARRPQMERRSGVVCADLIESMRADIALFIMYSLKRLACVTFPAFLEKEKKEKTRYTHIA